MWRILLGSVGHFISSAKERAQKGTKGPKQMRKNTRTMPTLEHYPTKILGHCLPIPSIKNRGNKKKYLKSHKMNLVETEILVPPSNQK